MHPAVRVFLVALVMVLVCSHLILNMATEKPSSVVSRHLTAGLKRRADEGKRNDQWKNELMDRIGDMANREVRVTKSSHARNEVEEMALKRKIPVEVVVAKTMRQDDEVDEGEDVEDEDVEADGDERMDQDEDVDGTERKDEGVDCDGSNGEGNDGGGSSD